MKQTAEQSWTKFLWEITALLNDPSVSWKVQRNLLRYKFFVPEDAVKALVPQPEFYEPKTEEEK